jgi:hypothetical protein
LSTNQTTVEKRKRCLALQSLVFSSAHSVIVLDPSLSSVVVSSLVDALICIRCSG